MLSRAPSMSSRSLYSLCTVPKDCALSAWTALLLKNSRHLGCPERDLGYLLPFLASTSEPGTHEGPYHFPQDLVPVVGMDVVLAGTHYPVIMCPVVGSREGLIHTSSSVSTAFYLIQAEHGHIAQRRWVS